MLSAASKHEFDVLVIDDLSRLTRDSVEQERTAAELYKKQIADGLDGNPEAATKACTILRDMLGEIRLKPASDGGLWAEYGMNPATLIMSAGTVGRGDRT